ncbi:MAG: 50S ribosomal protein L9 [Myxococcota bacterium]|jgi:large subunit ribosomal protein L9|nr:50S ribosomal protein L9 [Myxococcota bacterium]
MKVILTEDVPNLGLTGETVNVKDGYGRNYLFPRNLAVEASGKTARHIEHQQRIIEAKLNKRRSTAQDLKRAIENLSLSVPVYVGEEDKLYGSVTNRDIEQALQEKSIEVDRRKILLKEPIRQLGMFEVEVKLHPEVSAKLKIWVVKKETT